MWQRVWGTVSNRIVKEDLSKKEGDEYGHTNKTDEAHDSNQTENWGKKLATLFHCASTIHLLFQTTKVNISCDGHIHHF